MRNARAQPMVNDCSRGLRPPRLRSSRPRLRPPPASASASVHGYIYLLSSLALSVTFSVPEFITQSADGRHDEDEGQSKS